MPQRLPVPGSDNGTWGYVLNGFLAVAHNADGTLNTSAVSSALPSPIPTANLGTGTASSSNFLRGDSTWAAPPAGVALDATVTDIQPLGTRAAGSIGQAADAGHIHAMPTLNQVSSPTSSVSLNSQKITNLSNGTASTDAAAFGQIPISFIDVTKYGAVGDGVTNNTTAFASAISAATTAGLGTVYVPSGKYKVSSSARTDAGVTYSAGTWSDTHITSGDVGSYVIGVGIKGVAPKIVSVSAGVSFTTDVAPGATISSASVTIISPGIVIPDGITLQGVGAAHGSGGATSGGSIVYDAGTGVTVLLRGGNNTGGYFGRSRIRDLSIWGFSTGNGTGTTLAGIWVNNNDSFLEISNADISGHGTYGLALDYNINSVDCRNTLFAYCGTAGSTIATGGVGIQPFNTFVSAAINFYNCWWTTNYGFGIVGVAAGCKVPVSLYGCQWNNTFATSYYQSGSAVSITDTNSLISNCWMESSSTYDVIVNFGSITITSSVLGSSSSYAIYVNNASSTVALVDVTSKAHTTATITNNGGYITYMGCKIQDPSFISGGPNATNAAGIGAITGPAVSAGGMSPGNFGTIGSNFMWQGSGVPSNSNGSNGDTYFRTDTPGTANQRMYVKSAGSWIGIV